MTSTVTIPSTSQSTSQPTPSPRSLTFSQELHRYLHTFKNVLPSALMERIVAAKHQPNKEETSYWYPVSSLLHPHLTPPYTATEQAIQWIYHHIIRPMNVTDVVGCEYWIHSRPIDTYMHMHVDRDEGYYQRVQRMKQPLVASVFAVGDVGGPTLIVNQRTDEEMKSMYPEQPTCGWRFHQHRNHMITFPGNRLHGVLAAEPQFKWDDEKGDFVKIEPSPSTSRITLMMNWWPIELEDDTCISLEHIPYHRTRYGEPVAELDVVSTPSSHTEIPCDTIDTDIHTMYYFDLHAARECMYEYDDVKREKQSLQSHSQRHISEPDPCVTFTMSDHSETSTSASTSTSTLTCTSHPSASHYIIAAVNESPSKTPRMSSNDVIITPLT